MSFREESEALVPKVEELRPPAEIDEFDDFDFDPLFPGETNASGTPAGEVPYEVDFSKLFDEFDAFVKAARNIQKAEREYKSNQKDALWYPAEEDLKFLEFERKILQKHLNGIDGTNARSRAFVSMAKAKLAGMRRAYEMRTHSRLDYYAQGFIDSWIDRVSLQEEQMIVHDGSGDT
jgi:hypothetical protein